MLEHERAHLMPMPAPFDGYVEKPARVSSTCLVSVARNRYSVPCELAGRWSARGCTRRAWSSWPATPSSPRHERLSDGGQTRYDWQHYIPLVQRKPGALRNGAPFADMPEPLQRLRRALLRARGRRPRDGAGAGRGARRPGWTRCWWPWSWRWRWPPRR